MHKKMLSEVTRFCNSLANADKWHVITHDLLPCTVNSDPVFFRFGRLSTFVPACDFCLTCCVPDSPQGDRDGEIEDEEQHCDEEEQTSEGPPHPHRQRWRQIEQQHQQRGRLEQPDIRQRCSTRPQRRRNARNCDKHPDQTTANERDKR